MSILNCNMSLHEIEECLEKEVLNSVRIIGDIDLTNEDMNYLSLKIKGLNRFTSDISVCETYKLALLISLVFQIKREEEIMGNINYVRNMYQKLPQHHIRFFLELFEDTFNEYGITTFDLDTRHFNGLFSILTAHAGIPEYLHRSLYHLLDQSLLIDELNAYKVRVRNEIFLKVSSWPNQYIDEKCLWNLLNDCRNLLIDCKLNELEPNELFHKYNWLSTKLINNCIDWCDDYAYLRKERS